jgi:EAL domain-containing protein (putative c-di-GMP-specific phosphodiesterase class I)
MSGIVSRKKDNDSNDVYELLPGLPQKKGTLLVSLSSEHLVEKLSEYLNLKNIKFEIFEQNIQFQTELLEHFVLDLIDKNNVLNEMEMDAVNLLFLEQHEKLDLSTFGKTQSLLKTYRLVKGKDLIYILNNKTLKTYFQPIVDVRNNEIFAYECLSRGIRKDGTLMGSSLIFKTATKNDLLYYLDREARETAIVSAVANNITKKIFINFVPSAIYNPDTSLKDTMEWVEKYNLNPENIIFEVIETESIVDTKYLKRFLEPYRKQGFKIALDDIGSGYSSLTLLAELKPDFIKVDMEIIRDIYRKPYKQSVFKALSYICKENKIKLLAEGVETIEELEFCVSNGADFAQGFYFSKPTLIPVEKIK